MENGGCINSPRLKCLCVEPLDYCLTSGTPFSKRQFQSIILLNEMKAALILGNTVTSGLQYVWWCFDIWWGGVWWKYDQYIDRPVKNQPTPHPFYITYFWRKPVVWKWSLHFKMMEHSIFQTSPGLGCRGKDVRYHIGGVCVGGWCWKETGFGFLKSVETVTVIWPAAIEFSQTTSSTLSCA